jgi:hypothetical protein
MTAGECVCIWIRACSLMLLRRQIVTWEGMREAIFKGTTGNEENEREIRSVLSGAAGCGEDFVFTFCGLREADGQTDEARNRCCHPRKEGSCCRWRPTLSLFSFSSCIHLMITDDHCFPGSLRPHLPHSLFPSFSIHCFFTLTHRSGC